MRVICPKCGATYALGAEAVPQGGSHVQCGACHTRWFVRPERPAPAALSEDQIVARLERRSDPPAVTGDPPPARTSPILFPGGLRPAPVAARPPAHEPEPTAEASPAPAATPLRPRAPVAGRAAPAPVAAAPAAAPPRGRRFIGFATALGLSAMALAAYLGADSAAARAPIAETALARYVTAVESGRQWVEMRLGPLRDRLIGS